MKPAAPRKLNLLMLCGYTQNGEYFRQRTGSMRKALKATCEFHYVDPPHEATASFLTADADGDGRRALGWWNAAEDAERPAASKTYVGLEESLALVRRTIEEKGPFDGVLGFSQGATLAALLCLAPAPQPPVRFAVLFAGFMPRDASLEPLVGPMEAPPPRRVAMPSFHVMGEGDALVPIQSSRRLAECFDAPRLFTHEGGHAVPSSAELRAALKDFVASVGGEGAAAGAPPPQGGDAASSSL